MLLGDLVRQYRSHKQWTQGQLAVYTNLSQSFISRLERNDYDSADPRVLDKIARALDAPLSEFLAAAGYSQKHYESIQPPLSAAPVPPEVAALGSSGVPDKDLQELAALWEDLPDEDRQMALRVLRSIWEQVQSRAESRAKQKHAKARPAPSDA